MTTHADKRNVATDGELLWAIKKLLEERFPDLGLKLDQLRAQCSEDDQRRIALHPEYDRGTVERWAWHAGYVACLGSILHLINQQLTALRAQHRKERDPEQASQHERGAQVRNT